MTTSTPSQARLFPAGQWDELCLLSPEDSPALRFLRQESDAAKRMTVISGLRCIESSEKSGQLMFWQRTCLGSSAWKVGLTGYSLTWTRAATPQGRLLFRLRLSAPRTAGIASGSLHTPTATANQLAPLMVTRDAGSYGHGMWPTPRVEGFDAGKHRGQADSLHSAVKMLPTPCQRDHKTGMADRAGDDAHTQNLPERTAADLGLKSAKLSAAWVTRLMGFPDGYLENLPPDPLAKER